MRKRYTAFQVLQPMAQSGKKEAPVNCKSLKLGRINFELILFAIRGNEAATQLSTPQSTVHQILRNILRTQCYEYPFSQRITAQDKEVHYTLCRDVLSEL